MKVVKVNHFDVIRVMAERDLEIMFGPDILQMNKVKAGTQVTVGLPGDLVFRIADGQLRGGLMLWNKEQFDAITEELQLAGAGFNADGELLAAANALVIPFEGAMWSGPPATLVAALDRLREAVKKAEEGA